MIKRLLPGRIYTNTIIRFYSTLQIIYYISTNYRVTKRSYLKMSFKAEVLSV